jgi:hypothetical protein
LEQAGSGGMLTLTSLTILLRWEQAVSGGSGFAGSKLVAVDWASLVGGYDMISWKNNRRVKYPMLVIVMVVMVMVVMVMVVMVMVVVEMTIEKGGLMKCMQYEKCASICNSILHIVTPA